MHDTEDNGCIYIIVYPASDRTRLSIVSIEECVWYELDEYKRASRHIFHSPKDVVEYARNLSLKHSLPLDSYDSEINELLKELVNEDDYLD